MQDKQYSIYSPTANGVLGTDVYVVDATQEPLMALKLMIDGLAEHASSGVWLGPFEQIPRVQGFATQDIVFLDASMRVLRQAQLRPQDEFPVVAGTPASLLLLPRGSLANTPIQPNEQLIFYVPDSPGAPPSLAVINGTLSPATAKASSRGSSGSYKPIDTVVPPVNAPHAVKAATEPKKEPTIKRFLRWIDPTLVNPPEMRISMRRPSPELVAYRWKGDEPHAYRIGDISSTGVYLLTDERWKAGERVQLSLQREGPPQDDPRHRVEIEAEAVRLGSEGVGFRFVLPLGMDLHLWETMHESGSDMSKPEYIVNEMRYAEALAFLQQICPTGGQAMKQLIEKELGVARMACAIEIILTAKELLADEMNDKMRAHPGVVLRIIENGSWAETDLIRRYWAGLLASACSVDGKDISNLPHVDSFSLMRAMHFQLLAEGSRRVDEGIEPACLPDELPRITGTSDLTPIYRAIALLGELGLLEKSAKSTYAFGEKVRIVPTDLGRQLMARCTRSRLTV